MRKRPSSDGLGVNLQTVGATAAAVLLTLLAASGGGEGPVNDNEGTPPGITEGEGEDVGPEEDPE